MIVASMNTPTDHITVHFPMTGRTRKTSNFVWRHAKPSRPMAYVTLLLLSNPPKSLLHGFASQWLSLYHSAALLNWKATMASMFGVRWNLKDDENIMHVRGVSEMAPVSRDESQDGLLVPFILAMIGQIPLNGFIELIRNDLVQWDRDLPRIAKLPGSEKFLRDIAYLLEGNSDRVSWAGPSCRDRSRVPGVSGRQLQALRRGDAMLLDPVPRSMSTRELERRCQSLAIEACGYKKCFIASVVEFPSEGEHRVLIHRVK